MTSHLNKGERAGAMVAEIVPPLILPRALRRFDLVVIYFALIFGSYGAAQMAAGGWASIPMLLLATVLFLVPCALCSYELGTLYPGEGGIYIWAHKAFGPLHGFIAGWLSWVPIFFLLPLGAITVTAHLQFALSLNWTLTQQILSQVVFILLITALSAQRIAWSQRFIRLMFFAALATAAAVLLVGVSRVGRGTPLTNEILSFDLKRHGSLFSVAILWLLGVEVPFNMGAEFSDHRKTAGTMLLWGSLALLLGYIAGIVGVLLATPMSSIDATTGVARAVGLASPFGGSIVALVICFAVGSQDVAYMNAYSRLLFISGIERRLPEVFGQVTPASRVPVPALLAQAAGAIAIVIGLSSQAKLAVAFNLYIAGLTAVWCAALFYIYFGVVRARMAHREAYVARGTAVWLIPGGKAGLLLTAAVGIAFNLAAIYYVFAIPLTNEVSAERWRVLLLIVAGAVAVSGVVIYKLGESRARSFGEEHALERFVNNLAKSRPERK
jgi:glutamate:GABA antiporter